MTNKYIKLHVFFFIFEIRMSEGTSKVMLAIKKIYQKEKCKGKSSWLNKKIKKSFDVVAKIRSKNK